MTEIDSISIEREDAQWVLRLTDTMDGGSYTRRYTIGDPGQFHQETQRTLGRWLSAGYAPPIYHDHFSEHDEPDTREENR